MVSLGHVDGSVLAQSGSLDMRTPIACFLAWPARMAPPSPRLDSAARAENTLIRANSENFPVGSFLIPAASRTHVHAFYLFARTADDIADSPHIRAAEKVAQLQMASDALGEDETALPDWAVPYHRSLIETGCSAHHGRDLLSAFIQDATKRRYDSWDELMDYCRRSASSVGRVMMDIHGETRRADLEGSDALCNALQVLNHLQDCKKDFLTLDRVYLPEPWLREAGGGVAQLAGARASPSLRRTIDRCLEGTAGLLGRAEAMPRSVGRRRFRWECAVIVKQAWALHRRLARDDPLASRVRVSRLGRLSCAVSGIVGAW